MEINDITNVIIGAAIKVHSELGPGLLESAYSECLAYELGEVGLKVEREKTMPVVYKGIQLECGYRIDLLVEDKVVVELKAVKSIEDVHMAQILTYLKLANCKIGLLINFNEYRVKDGIRRLINKYYQEK
ncbi:MAG: GxxExxY protein [Flammeovirgaceae bacterium]|nr:GxxExxY protein [Flammeovirgaceae bacterium]MBE62439.1 GxxExxY protein [Flammeovirgaceae bacterium]HCX23621.1 GxxExxY protein [Cytophagales bacterium]|tara:strand:+ start:298 stop:687 length:390 start_codon:yes stop_codon:yes gene_type:complete